MGFFQTVPTVKPFYNGHPWTKFAGRCRESAVMVCFPSYDVELTELITGSRFTLFSDFSAKVPVTVA